MLPGGPAIGRVAASLRFPVAGSTSRPRVEVKRLICHKSNALVANVSQQARQLFHPGRRDPGDGLRLKPPPLLLSLRKGLQLLQLKPEEGRQEGLPGLEGFTRGVSRKAPLKKLQSKPSLRKSLQKPGLDIALVRGLRKQPLHKLNNYGNSCSPF